MSGFILIAGRWLSKAGRFMLGNPGLVFGILLSAAFAIIVVSKNSEIKTLNKQINDPQTGYQARIDRLTAALTTARNNNTVLTQSLATQNAAIMELKAQGDAQGGKFDALMAAEQARTDKVNATLAGLAAAKPGADKCASAFNLVRSTLP